MELYGTLLAGPPSWRNAKLPVDCKIDGLANRMQIMLERLLAAELSRVLAKWIEWDIPRLRRHHAEAVQKTKAVQATQTATDRVPPVWLTGRDRLDRTTPLFVPRGRT